jgi:glycosyltransferase involved in cell wall biosynthesis
MTQWMPWRVASAELSDGLLVLHDVLSLMASEGGAAGAWILCRVFGEPMGLLKVPFARLPDRGDGLRDLIEADMRGRVLARLSEDGVTGLEGALPLTEIRPSRTPEYVRRQRAVCADGPPVTAVVCTRDRPEGLSKCLSSLQAQNYPRLSILVVDNAPSTDASAEVARLSSGPHEVSYTVEPKPGLSWARNRSLEVADTEIVAWIDDDELADDHWVTELAATFAENPAVSAVCGIMLPAEIESPAQELFEQYGGHSKGRGFQRATFSPATWREQHPLFPLPPFGTGGNMALRRGERCPIDRFDTALGAGTRSAGAEDTRALTDILLAGGTVCYQPTAVTWHFHRRDMSELQRQLHGYGVGLAAFYSSIVVDRPALILQLVRLLPMALREFRSPDGARLGGIADAFPPELLKAHRRGFARGPFEYAMARRLSNRRGRLSLADPLGS